MRASFLWLLMALACSSSPTTSTAPKTSDAAPLSTNDAESILRALSRSHQEATQAFGQHQLTVSSESKLSKEKELVLTLQEDFSLVVDSASNLYLKSTNNQNEGVEAYLIQGKPSLAMRYGPLQPTAPIAVERARDAAYGAVFASLDPLSPWLSFQADGEREIAGKSGLVFTLQQREGRAPALATLSPEKAWRATIAPSSLTGELVLDAKSGFLLYAGLRLEYVATRDQQELSFDVTIKSTLSAHGDAVAAIKLPEVDEIEPRIRMEKERLALIGKTALQQQKEKKKKAPKWTPSTKPSSQETPAKTPTSAPQ